MINFINPPLTVKALNNSEQTYLNNILNGLDSQMNETLKWLNSQEARELFIQQRSDIRDFFENSGIQESWDKLINNNAENSKSYIESFYAEGSRLGYKDIQRTLHYTFADQEALWHLKNYNFHLITDINEELVYGLRKTISNAVALGESMPKLREKLLELPIRPIKSNMNVRSRAMTIARTEYGRARQTGRLQAHANYGVQLEEVVTAGDEHVCTICRKAEDNNPYPIDDAKNLPLFHPRCRCTSIPVIDEPLPLDELDDPKVIVDETIQKFEEENPTKTTLEKQEIVKPFKETNYEIDEDDKLLNKQNDLQMNVRYDVPELESVNNWGHSGYESINKYLYKREGYVKSELSESTINHLNNKINNIDSAIGRSPKLSQDTTLYRFGHWEKGLKAGDESKWDGFTSTSYSASKATGFASFGRYEITIYADEGTSGILLNKQFDALTREREWLLPRGQRYKVLEVDDDLQTAKIRLLS